MDEDILTKDQLARLLVVERLMQIRKTTGFAHSSPVLDNGYLTYVAGWVLDGPDESEPDEEETVEVTDFSGRPEADLTQPFRQVDPDYDE